MTTDPVCGMEVNPAQARDQDLVAVEEGDEYFFCSRQCRDDFVGDVPWYRTETFSRVFPYVLGVVLVGGVATAIALGYMVQFMGLFFILFSVAKMPDWPGFVDAFRTYDLLAARLPGYALAYPAIEFGLGILFLSSTALAPAAVVTLLITGIGAIGVAQKTLHDPDLQCACLGTWMDLPLTKITLLENLLMAGMAAVFLLSL